MVLSIAYSPNGQNIISRSNDSTIKPWDAEACTSAGKPLGEHIRSVWSVAYSSYGTHITSGSYDDATCVLDAFPYPSIQSTSCNPMHSSFCAKPDKDGWVKDSEGGLLYWVPHDYCTRLHSPAIMTIPLTSCKGTVSLDFDDIAFGTSWSQIFKSAPF